MEAVNGVKKKKGAHPLVKILTAMAKFLQVAPFSQQLFQGCVTAKSIQRLIADRRVRRGNYIAKVRCHSPWTAIISTKLARTSARSRPSNASASCAVNN